MTGAPLEVTIRFQANFLVRPIEDIALFQDVPRIFMPAMWFEQKFVMDEEMAEQIKIAIQIPWIGRVVAFVLLGIGVLLVLISILITIIQSRRRSRRQQMEIEFSERKSGSPLISQTRRPQIVQHKK